MLMLKLKLYIKQPRHLEKLIGRVDQELNNVRLSPTHTAEPCMGYWLFNILSELDTSLYLGNSPILKTTSSCEKQSCK